VRVGVTPDPDQQRRVIDDRSLGVIKAAPLRDPQSDQALAQHVLHRLTETKIDPQRQRRYELRETDVGPVNLLHAHRSYRHR
jgi:hypothetical protein